MPPPCYVLYVQHCYLSAAFFFGAAFFLGLAFTSTTSETTFSEVLGVNLGPFDFGLELPKLPLVILPFFVFLSPLPIINQLI